MTQPQHQKLLTRWAIPVLSATLFLSACSGSSATPGTPEEDTENPDSPSKTFSDSKQARAVVSDYAKGVHAMYEASTTSATQMDNAISKLVEAPTEETLQAARQAWLDARDGYSPTEAFRFYSGPIDNEDTGLEGQINAWPLDEAYIDYVDGKADAGIINNPDEFPTIDAELLISLNEKDGETNISTGWHAIEFLLWGQDLSEDGPGDRPVTDYTTEPNAERRGQYLAAASEQLVKDLQTLVDAWSPDQDNYRTTFEALDTAEALTHILTGIGELSRGELAGERINVAYSERSQEDEHSCFSDNTTADIVANAKGIQIVLSGEYPGAKGEGVLTLVEATNPDLATTLTEQVDASVQSTETIPAPFDQHLGEDVPEDSPGRASILTAIEALEAQTETIVEAAVTLGVPINVT